MRRRGRRTASRLLPGTCDARRCDPNPNPNLNPHPHLNPNPSPNPNPVPIPNPIPNPNQGVTPLAERLRELRPRLQAFAAEAGPSGQCAFLVLVTDGAPTPPDSGTPTPAAAAAALRELRGLTTALPVRLVVRLCTDEESAVSFWNQVAALTVAMPTSTMAVVVLWLYYEAPGARQTPRRSYFPFPLTTNPNPNSDPTQADAEEELLPLPTDH